MPRRNKPAPPPRSTAARESENAAPPLFEDLHRAMLNILEDSDAEKTTLQQVQLASLNILEDSSEEKEGLKGIQRATVNILEDFEEEKSRIEETQRAVLNILDDFDTERAKVENANQELVAANKELEAFSYSVSHDLRAPLRHIDGFSKLLLEEYGDRLPDEGKRYLSLVRDGARQMGQLVDDLLALSRIGRKEVSVQIVGLNSLVEEVVTGLKHECSNRAIEWKVAPLPFVECDPVLMRQVLVNLLSNAVKYTRPRERAVIEVGFSQENGHRAFFVRDNGVGFNMKYADKLFGVFQRLHRSEDFEGTGVGLATVQRIITKHGGRVWAKSALDEGATFFFTLGAANENRARAGPRPGEKP